MEDVGGRRGVEYTPGQESSGVKEDKRREMCRTRDPEWVGTVRTGRKEETDQFSIKRNCEGKVVLEETLPEKGARGTLEDVVAVRRRRWDKCPDKTKRERDRVVEDRDLGVGIVNHPRVIHEYLHSYLYRYIY